MSERIQRMVEACRPTDRRLFSIVKILEKNCLSVVENGKLQQSAQSSLYITKHEEKECHAILVHSGEQHTLKRLLPDLVNYERSLQKYSNFLMSSVSVQTESILYENKEVQTNTTEMGESYSLIEKGHSPSNLSQYSVESGEYTVAADGILLKKDSESDDCQKEAFDKVVAGTSFEPYADLIPDLPEAMTIDEVVAGTSLEPHNDFFPASPEAMNSDFEGGAGITSFQPYSDSVPTSPAEAKSLGSSKKRRKQFCIFCKRDISNLFRHLLSAHKTEERLKKALEMSPEKKSQEMANIRREGYTEKYGQIEIKKGGKHGYLPCTKCGSMYSKKNLYKHYKICTNQKPPKQLQTIAKHKKLLEEKTGLGIDPELQQHVLTGMACNDELFEAITNDRDIISFGNRQCLKFGDEIIEKQKNSVRNKLRQFAKVRLGMTKLDAKVTGIVDVFKKEQWDNLMKVIVELSHLKSTDTKKQAPTNVLHLGLLLSGLARDISACMPLKSEVSKEIKGWLEMFERLYRTTIGWQANRLSVKKKWQAKKLEPLANDLFKLNQFVKCNIENSKSILKNCYQQSAWIELSKAAMVHLLTFNRKRVGELTTITVDDYKRKDKIRENTDTYLGLSESEKIVAARYYHLTIRGKLARPVPLLINVEMAGAIDLLLKYRNEAGVSKANNYLFAKSDSKHFDANVVLREYANECGAERPEDLTSTRLRKHIATVSQSLNMTEGDLRILAGYMGHTTKTHLEKYRLPSDAVHAARFSQLLTALDEGRIHEFHGKRFEDINTDCTVDADEDDEDSPNRPNFAAISAVSTKESKEKPLTAKKPKLKTAQREATMSEIPTTSSNPILEQENVGSGRHSPIEDTYTTPEKNPSHVKEAMLTPTPPVKKKRYSTVEKLAMKKFFSEHIKNEIYPKECEVRAFRSESSPVKHRKIHLIKAWVNNQIAKRKRLRKEREEEETSVDDSE